MAFDKNHTTTVQKVVIIIFAVVLVVSMCLPFFSSCSATGDIPVETQQADTDEPAETVSATVEAVRGRYASIIERQEKKLQENPQNTTAMASLGHNYMDMASAISQVSDGTDTSAAAKEAYDKAIEYFDMYLEIEDSPAIRIDRDTCLFNSDRADEAVADLYKYATGVGAENANVWFNLGYMYMSQGDYESSVAAFQKASELDADGSKGVYSSAMVYQSLAQQMLDSELEVTTEDSAAQAEPEAKSETAIAEEPKDEPAAEKAEEPAARTETAAQTEKK